MATATQQNQGAPDQFELVLRLHQSRTSPPADAAPGRSSAHALVQDVLKARLQVDAQEGGENLVHAHGYSELGKALAASRALQMAFEGFRSASPSIRTNISVVLDAPEPGEQPAGPSLEQRELLALARPSQVLITQSLYNRIAHTQAMALRSFPTCAGVYEFLWTSVERLDQLRAEGELMPTLVIDPEPVMQAQEETVISYPAPRFSEPTAHDLRRPPMVQERPLAQTYEEDEKPSRPVGKILGLTTVAVLLIAGCGFAVWRYMPLSPTPLHHASPVARTPSPEPAPPVIQDAAPLKSTVPPPVPIPVPRPRQSPEPKQAAVPPILRKGANCAIEGYEIPQYLDLADKNRNRGQYDAAEREYNTVLGCQPGNRAARDGLARLRGR